MRRASTSTVLLCAAIAASMPSGGCEGTIVEGDDAAGCPRVPSDWADFLANGPNEFRGAYTLGFFNHPPVHVFLRAEEYMSELCGCAAFEDLHGEFVPPDQDTRRYWLLLVEFTDTLPGQYEVTRQFSHEETTQGARLFVALHVGRQEVETHYAVSGTVVLERGVTSLEDWHTQPRIRISGTVEFLDENVQSLGCSVEGQPDGGPLFTCYCQDANVVVTSCTSEDGADCCQEVEGATTPWQFEIVEPEQCPRMCSAAGGTPGLTYSCEDL